MINERSYRLTVDQLNSITALVVKKANDGESNITNKALKEVPSIVTKYGNLNTALRPILLDNFSKLTITKTFDTI